MSGPSPICTVNGSSPPQDVSGGSTVTVALANPAGANFWFLSCVGADETTSVSAINASLSISLTNHTATFTAPAGAGTAVILMSTVGIVPGSALAAGLDQNFTAQPSFTTTFKVNVPASNGARVMCTNETFEQDATHGWIGSVNTAIRTASSSGGPTQNTVTLSNGLNSNISTSGKTTLRFAGPTSAFSAGGFTAPASAGQVLVVVNTTTQPMTIVHEDTSSTAANRIDTRSTTPVVIPPGAKSAVVLMYDGTTSRWSLQNPGLLFANGVDLRYFGALGTGSGSATVDTAAFQAALTVANALGAFPKIIVPPGTFYINSELSAGGSNGGVIVEGQSHAFNTDVTTIVANATMRSIFNVTNGYCKFRGLKLNGNAKATYGFYRQGDSYSQYDDCYAVGCIYAGIHAARVADGWTISSVSHSGSGSGVVTVTNQYPLGAFTVQIKMLSATTFEYYTDGSTYAGTFTIPSNGVVNLGDTSSGGGGSWTGITVTFSGTFTTNDTYSFTTTATATVNDSCVFERCWATGNGQVYQTSDFPSDYSGFTHSTAAGTVAISASSSTIVGTGTAFVTGMKIRNGDFIRVGGTALPKWQAGHTYSNGALVTSYANAPGVAAIWQSSGGTSGGSEPSWPMTNVQITAGLTVTDNGMTWTCVGPAFFQILNAQDDTHLLIDSRGQPGVSIASIGFAVLSGHGYYEEISDNNNINRITGGLWRGNAASGLTFNGLYGPVLIDPQVDTNGGPGIVVGTDNGQATCHGTVILRPYFEANYGPNLWAGCIFHSLQMLGANTDSNTAMAYGNPAGSGGWMAVSAGLAPIGSATGGANCTLPVTQTASVGNNFQINGTISAAPNNQIISAGTTIDASQAFLTKVGPGSLFTLHTAAPAISAATSPDQEIELYNYSGGNFTLILQDRGIVPGNNLELQAPQVALPPRASMRLRWYAGDGLWHQVSPVVTPIENGMGGAHSAQTFVQTTDATQTVLMQMVCPANTVTRIHVKTLVATDHQGADSLMVIDAQVCLRNNNGAVTADVSSTGTSSGTKSGVWTVAWDTTTATVKLKVTGAAATTINWCVDYEWCQVTGS